MYCPRLKNNNYSPTAQMLNITQAIIVFLVVAIFIVMLFCLAAWYFDRKNRHKYESALNEQLETSMNNPLSGEAKNAGRNIEMQLLASHSPINMTKMSERAGVESTRLNFMTGLNNPTDRLAADLGNRSARSSQPPPTSKEVIDLRHTFVNRLAYYSEDGIEMYSKEVTAIRPTKVFKDLDWQANFKEVSSVNRVYYPSDSPNLQDIIDLLRFEECDYGKGVKWMVDLDLRNAQYDKEYKVEPLPKHEYFEFLTTEEYRAEVAKLSQV